MLSPAKRSIIYFSFASHSGFIKLYRWLVGKGALDSKSIAQS